MSINPEEFHKSITKELEVIQNRVRNLIGYAHWGEEGRYKEAILRSTMRRFLPENVSLGTGFVLKKEKNVIKISSQIDIILYDNTYPVLFAEGDFLITTPTKVKGIIEVKTRLDASQVIDVVSKATENGKIVGNKTFNGIFVYNGGNIVRDDFISNNLERALEESQGVVNHICLGENFFIKFWPRKKGMNSVRRYSVYGIKGLSFSYFISNFVEETSESRLKERWWFLYPIEKGKEQYKIRDINV